MAKTTVISEKPALKRIEQAKRRENTQTLFLVASAALSTCPKRRVVSGKKTIRLWSTY